MKVITSFEGVEFLVDDEDFERLAHYKWRVDKDGYGQRMTAGKRIRMHREVMGLKYKDGNFVDHKNCIKTDNRKCNLRLCTPSQNSCNMRIMKNNTSGYKNVTWVEWRRKWVVRICKEGKRLLIGYFDSAEEGYKEYCKKAKEVHGEFANTGGGE